MTNPTIETLHRHASVRAYKPDPLPRENIAALVLAGQRASTSSNLQMYSVVALTDPQRRAEMQELCGNQRHISQAPVFLTWVADLSRLERICQGRGYEHHSEMVENFVLAAVDAAIAAQNAAVAAEALGLGICYIGAIRNNPRAVIELLGLPRLAFPLVGMTVGWPEHPPRLRPRLATEAILHWEQYDSRAEPEHLRRYDEEMIATGIYSGRQVNAQEPRPEAVYGWTEHSARRVSQPLRPHLREVLIEQGFELK
ncbi:MAG: nitroreductase family protein [Anaerolineales bacterium]|nr:nitroreductase family protein [Anaerolineales bacterium]